MLDDDCGVSNERPEIIRSNSRVPLKMIEKGLGICIVIRI